jgi:TPR repeat protein
MWALGVVYENGQLGIQKNLRLAKEWKDKAVAHGYSSLRAFHCDWPLSL